MQDLSKYVENGYWNMATLNVRVIINFHWLSGDAPRLPSYGVYISQLVRFARCCTSVSDFNSKNLKLTSKLLTQGYRCHKLRKTFGKFFRSYSDLLSKFFEISFQEYVTEGISHPVFYGDLVYKLRRVRCEAYFVYASRGRYGMCLALLQPCTDLS